MAIRSLSILIPTYNDPCFELVDTLRHQAEATGISYEIIVADDGSTSEETLKTNSAIDSLPNWLLISMLTAILSSTAA